MPRASPILLLALSMAAAWCPGAPAVGQAKKIEELPKGAIFRFANVRSIAVSPAGESAALADSLGAIRICELASGRGIRELPKPDTKPEWPDVCFAPDGKKLFYSGGTLALWDLERGQKIRSWGAQLLSRPLAYSPDGRMVAVAGWNHRIALFKVDSNEAPTQLEAKGNNIWSLDWSPNGNHLLSTAADGITVLWNVRQGVQERNWTVMRCACLSAFSSNGHALLCLTGDDFARKLCLVETATGLERWNIPFRQSFQGLAFSRDGRSFAIDENDAGSFGVGVYDVLTGHRRGFLAGHDAPPDYLRFSASGQLLVSHSGFGDVLVWDAKPFAVKRGSSPIDADTLQSSWDVLAGNDGARIHRAITALVMSPEDAIPFLKKQIIAIPKVATANLNALLAALDSSNFKTREEATKGFGNLGKQAEPFLRLSLEKGPTLETKRRIEQLLTTISTPTPAFNAEHLRRLRMLEVLELIGSPDARQAVAEFCEREPHADVWRIGKAALHRLELRGKWADVGADR